MVGQTVGKYRIVDRLGRGGMGTVYRAVDETLHREVAIKVLNAELNDPGIGRRFRAEAVAIARLNHPGIATIFELVQHEGEWLMVIEFVRGETLESLVEKNGALPPDHAAELCMQVLSALSHAHSMGVIHRDLKPANIMYTESGATKVMDFGIARVAGTEHLTSAGFMMGTPAFMAPEQVLAGAVDARTDLYAIGVVLYFLTTARLPFKGDTPMAMAQSRIKDLPTPIRAVRPDLPAWLAQVTERALSKAVDRRFQTADEFREALRRGVSGLAIDTLARPLFTPELVVTAEPGAMRAPESTPATLHPTPPRTIPAMTPPPSEAQSGSVPATGPLLTPASAPLIPASSEAVDPRTLPTVLGPIAAATKPPTIPPDKMRSAPAPSRSPWNTTTLAALGGVAILVIVAGVVVWRAGRAKTAPPASSEVSTAATAAPSNPAPAPGSADASVPPPPAAATPPPAPTSTAATVPPAPGRASGTGTPGAITGSGTGAPTGTPTGSPGTPPGTPPGASTAAPTGTGAGPVGTGAPGAPGTTGARASRGGRASVPDTGFRIDNLRLLVVSGRQGTERDALLYFGGGVIMIRSSTGEGITSLQYKDLELATYVHAKDPKWDETLASPPSNLDVPGGIAIFRSTRHWLVLQTKAAYAILRLEDDNWQAVIDTLAARTGVRIVQPAR